jgi:acyl-CoA synthetase (AMP-forming)/AMP-acid ligase II
VAAIIIASLSIVSMFMWRHRHSAVLDPEFRTGGTVVVVGLAHTITDPDLISCLAAASSNGRTTINSAPWVLPSTAPSISDDGEVQMRSPNVMAGYHNMVDATNQAFTDDGWLRSGDKGVLDDEGFLTISGRIKEMFKTSGGKYIVPPAIEAKFIALCPYASSWCSAKPGISARR